MLVAAVNGIRAGDETDDRARAFLIIEIIDTFRRSKPVFLNAPQCGRFISSTLPASDRSPMRS